MLGQGRAISYGVGVGREGFTWSGVQTISRKAEWPDWHPPAEMIARQPYLPRFMAGGPGNPLGARAMYLGTSEYRIHGTNDPSTIGKFVSTGCIRLTNEDVTDLFSRVECRHQGRGAAEECTRRRRARVGHPHHDFGSSGSRASASGGDHAAFGPPGDELDGVAAQLSRAVECRRRKCVCDRQDWQRWGRRPWCALPRWRRPRRRRISSRRCSAASAAVARAQPYVSMPFASDDGSVPVQRREMRPRYARRDGGGQAFCVRTCDGRYFPVTASDKASRAASCNSFCPASETKVVYGSSIDNAATDNGKPYSELPNAFRYRNEIVAGCTCNGKDQIGLAPVKIENDPTLRKGDIVAGDERPGGRRPQRRQTRRGAEFLARLRARALEIRAPAGGGEGVRHGIVMAGLDPAIHAFAGREDVDARVKPGHDECDYAARILPRNSVT